MDLFLTKESLTSLKKNIVRDRSLELPRRPESSTNRKNVIDDRPNRRTFNATDSEKNALARDTTRTRPSSSRAFNGTNTEKSVIRNARPPSPPLNNNSGDMMPPPPPPPVRAPPINRRRNDVDSCSSTEPTADSVLAKIVSERERKHRMLIEDLLRNPNLSNEDLCLMFSRIIQNAEQLLARLENESRARQTLGIGSNIIPETESSLFSTLPQASNNDSVSETTSINNAQSSRSSEEIFKLTDWVVLKTRDKLLRLGGKLCYYDNNREVMNWYETNEVTHFNSVTKHISTAGDKCKLLTVGRCSNYDDLPREVQLYFSKEFPREWRLAAKIWHSAQ